MKGPKRHRSARLKTPGEESPGGKLETILVKMPTPLYAAVMRKCKARKMTFSEFAREAVRERIGGQRYDVKPGAAKGGNAR